MSALIRLFLVVLMFPLRIADRIPFVQAILQAFTGNPRFQNPDPPLAQVQTAFADFEQAQAACKTRTKGAVQTRNEKWLILKDYLKRLARYVQTVANVNPAEAEAIIQSAGMKAKKVGVPHKPDFEVRHGRVSGEVKLIARRAAHWSSYEWQWSLDQKSWTTLPSKMRAKTLVGGLPTVTNCFFRVRIVTRHGEGDWSQPIAFVVL